MVKNVPGANHQGLRDWGWQRVSAIYLILYSAGLAGFILAHKGLDFTVWHTLFSYNWMKIATLLGVISLAVHTWVGMWTVFTDYVKSKYIISISLNVLMFFTLTIFVLWTLIILWGVQ